MATYTETDDASHREGVAARGLGACVWARAPKPEQTLSLQGSRYVDLSAFPSVFRRPVQWAKRCGRRPIDLNPPNLKRSKRGALRNSWIGLLYPGIFLEIRKCSQKFPWVLQSKAKVKRTPCGPSGGKLGVATSALESAAQLHHAASRRGRGSHAGPGSSIRGVDNVLHYGFPPAPGFRLQCGR